MRYDNGVRNFIPDHCRDVLGPRNESLLQEPICSILPGLNRLLPTRRGRAGTLFISLVPVDECACGLPSHGVPSVDSLPCGITTGLDLAG